MALHHRVHRAHEAHRDALTTNERIAVWCYQNMATVQCLYLFTGIGIGSLIGALTGNVFLTAVFGATSSYFIQFVSLAVIAKGAKIEGEQSAHVQSEILRDTEEILHIVRGVRPLKVANEETGADIIMPNIIRERFDQGEIKSLADLV